ncbi:MAG: hypothetical protein SFY56_06035 [Bacteroidota bacterium]|nr:hypothetical protein [Bacteroidota bacterium]
MDKERLKEFVSRWLRCEGVYQNLLFEHEDVNTRLFGGYEFEDIALCNDVDYVKPILVKNLQDALAKYGIDGNPEDYLRGLEANFAEKKAALIQTMEDVTWFNDSYPVEDNTYKDLLIAAYAKAKIPNQITKVFYDVDDFYITRDDLGNITGQAKLGLVFSQIPNCTFWNYQYFDLYTEYLGGGNYSEVKVFLNGYPKGHGVF